MSQGIVSITVVMPVRNEASSISESLGAVLAQDYPGHLMQVIVVDGMSNDGTRAIVGNMAKKDRRLIMIDNPKKITPCGLNLGIKRATGDLIFRVDGHAVITPDYVKNCVQYILSENSDAVGGAVDSEATTYVGGAIATCMSSSFGIGSSGFRVTGSNPIPVRVDTLPFWALRREVFDKIGFFNENMVRHQDYEFNYRLRSSGGTLLLLPWLRVKYYVRSTLAKFWRQYWQYGIWKGRFLRTYPRSARLRHFAPPLFVLALLLGAFLSLISPALGLRCLLVMLAFYTTFVATATAVLAARGHLTQAPLIPLILTSLHLIWGAGVCAGLTLGKIPVGETTKPLAQSDLLPTNHSLAEPQSR